MNLWDFKGKSEIFASPCLCGIQALFPSGGQPLRHLLIRSAFYHTALCTLMSYVHFWNLLPTSPTPAFPVLSPFISTFYNSPEAWFCWFFGFVLFFALFVSRHLILHELQGWGEEGRGCSTTKPCLEGSLFSSQFPSNQCLAAFGHS